MNIGKVYKYNGVTGEIATETKTYIFSYNGVEDNIQTGDIVSFNIRKDISNDIVTDIRKYEDKNLKQLLKEYKLQSNYKDNNY